MELGPLDRRIRIETPDVTQDAFGQPATTWTPLDTVWAQFISLTGSEGFTGQEWVGKEPAEFRTRWRNDITDTMRIVFDGNAYLITSTQEIGRREGLLISAHWLEADLQSVAAPPPAVIVMGG
jgi:SPP1 family predicted phage head-tail adaptor